MFLRRVWLLIIIIVTAIIVSGCSDSDSTSEPPPPPPTPPNTLTITTVSLTSLEVITGGANAGSATASLTLNLDDNTLTGTVALTNISADTVTLNQGYAGDAGEMLFNLQQDNSTTWSLPANSLLTGAMIDLLNNGELYLKLSSAIDGALRGQIITGTIQLLFTNLSGVQEVPAVTTTASARGAITLNPDSGAIVIHLNAVGLDDAIASHIHQALAGLNGAVIIITLTQDPQNLAHWSATDNLDSTNMASLNRGAFYLNLHSPAQPGGEVRGQIEPDGIEVIFTTLSGSHVIPPVTTANSGIAATTVLSASQSAEVHVNLAGLEDAISVTMNQAPVGQNGPIALSLTQDSTELAHWSLENVMLSAGQYAALLNQGLYFSVASPLEPNGEVRGQLTPDMSAPVGDASLLVSAVTPANGTTVAALPGSIELTFNRNLLTESVSLAQIELLASGNDGGFNDGNEVTVSAVNAVASGDSLSIDLSGAINVDDVYQLTLDGTSAAPITDTNGVVLDGDGDNNAGGDFISTFAVSTPVVTFKVSAITPVNGATVAAVPASIEITFNRNLLIASVSLAQIELLASGNDGGFNDGNEVTVVPASVLVSGDSLTIDLTGALNTDDVYQLTLDGSSSAPMTDTNGVVLDGDGNNTAGGDFRSTFTVSTPAAAVTLSMLKTEIFTPSCAFVGCHGGANPAQGMNLSAAQIFANIVDIASMEVPSLNRVEPGDPDNSYLVQKIEGSANIGGRMPLGGAALSAQDIQNIRQWIADGAKDD